ncbi:MAG: flagellar protein export ATPase FliI [Burkholderiaceae bacterium]|nr:flagellar protein export ATPase FliI [Burkholderiaceae bacterium]
MRPPLELEGRLLRVTGLVMEATGVRVPMGSVCEIHAGDGREPVLAEVVGFNGDRAFLMPNGEAHGLSSGARVVPRAVPRVPPRFGSPVDEPTAHPWRRSEDRSLHLPMGTGLLGRVVDSHGHPLDRQGPLAGVRNEPLARRSINAMDREPVRRPLDTGVRAINALLTVGRGQRLGLFAGTGVGKSVLLGMMARYTAADVIVVGLIGERGREVKEFVEDILGDDGRARSVVVAAPADAPPLVRLQGAHYATAIAEHFRDRGQHVLLLMDSLTRYCMAQREIALAIGEPPATKGYPPSVFAKLPALVERSGNSAGSGQGSITAFYTVLSEGDDQQDPVADAARGILDGHIVLSRDLAEAGHFPAIDVERSVSRVMTAVAPREQQAAARKARALLSRLTKARDLIALGAYQPGHDAELDLAVKLQPQLSALLQQDMHDRAPLDMSRAQLAKLLGAG